MTKLKIYQVPCGGIESTKVPIHICCHTDIVDPTYVDITSIESFDKYCTNHFITKEQIKILFEEQGWDAISEIERKIVCKHFLVDKTKRDLYLSEAEQASYNYYKIYDFATVDIQTNADRFDPPHAINYKTGLQKKLRPEYKINDQGFLYECIYYEDATVVIDSAEIEQITYHNPILKYNAEYTLGPNGLVTSRVVTRAWQLLDGTYSQTIKVTDKLYTGIMSRNEAKRRRQNIINKAIGDVIGLLMMTSNDLPTVSSAETDARQFIDEIREGVQDYIEYGIISNTPQNPNLLLSTISISTYARLNNIIDAQSGTTLRAYILNKLQYSINL